MKQTTNMSRVIGEIQSIGRKLNKDWFNGELDMERVIFVVSSTPKAYGHFTPYLSYRVHDKEGEKGAVEINIGAGTLDRPIEAVISRRMNKVLAELKEYNQMKKELDSQIKALQDECKEYMTEHELSELFNDDNSIVARYSEVISERFDSTSFKKSEWGELYKEYCKKVTSIRFTLN